MPKFLIQETVGTTGKTARFGSAAGSANFLTSADVGKAVKLVANSQYDLCAVGDRIEGIITSVEGAPLDNFSVGSFRDEDYVAVTFEGSQAAGTGAIAIGDFVVAGTPVARGTAQSTPLKVRKATNQPGTTPADLTAAGDQIRISQFAWRVVSLGNAGTGAVGTTGVIERVNT